MKNLKRLIQIFSNKIHVGDIVSRNDNPITRYKVKKVAGDTITIQDEKHKHVEIAMSIKSVKKLKFLTYIDNELANEESHGDIL